MAPVTLAGVRKRFGASEVLHGVSLDVADGEFAALVGPSGCGKSTLLRLIAGLEGLDAGEIRIAGRRVDDLPARDRDVAMVFQNYALYPHLSVFENMAFALRVRRAPRAEVERRVRATAAVLGLADLLERFPRQLSGGQRQRVAMGRAIVRDPSVFLFDEPLSNLDAQLRVAMRSEIKALHQRVGGTTVYVTHDQIEAMTLADRIVVMRDGEVEQVGAPLELYDAPANLFVAGFIGSPAMNLIRGTVRRGDGAVLETTGGHRLALPPRLAAVAGAGAAVLGLRPQALGPGDGDASGDGGGLPVEVATVEPTGAELQIVATHGDDTVTAVVRERLALRPGDRLRLTPDLDRAHLFDAATGRVLRP